jgi:hypothetical protein
MNFENADARDDMQVIVNKIKSECENLISELQTYQSSLR